MFKRQLLSSSKKTNSIQAEEILNALDKLSGEITCTIQFVSSSERYISPPIDIRLVFDSVQQKWVSAGEATWPVDRNMTVDFGIIKYRYITESFNFSREYNVAQGDILTLPRGMLIWEH